MSLTVSQNTFLLVVLLAILQGVGAITVSVDVRTRPFVNTILLNCGGTNLMNVTYQRTFSLNGQQVTQSFKYTDEDNAGVAMFELTPLLEGNYSCVNDSNAISSNYITLIGE